MSSMNAIKYPEAIALIRMPSMVPEVFMAKSAVFGVMHVGIAFGVRYALSDSVAVAGTIAVIEPLCNTVAH